MYCNEVESLGLSNQPFCLELHVRYKQRFHTPEEQHYLLYNYVGLSNVCLLAITMSLSEICNPGRKIQIKAGQIEAMAD